MQAPDRLALPIHPLCHVLEIQNRRHLHLGPPSIYRPPLQIFPTQVLQKHAAAGVEAVVLVDDVVAAAGGQHRHRRQTVERVVAVGASRRAGDQDRGAWARRDGGASAEL